MLAVKDGKLAQNPVSALKFFREGNRTRFLSNDELVRLRNVMSVEDWRLVAFAIETGLRRGEQFRLQWTQVDLENGVLTLPLPKGRKTRHVPLSDEAKAILRSSDSFLRSVWVFPGLRKENQPMDSRAFLRRSYEPGLRKAGITGSVLAFTPSYGSESTSNGRCRSPFCEGDPRAPGYPNDAPLCSPCSGTPTR